MTIRWYGLVAPEEAPTGDRRMFAAQALDYRNFPLPAAWQRVSGSGHSGSVVVASWDRQYASEGGIWAEGTFLDPNVVPEVLEAMYLLQKKLIGPSVDLDPDLAYEIVAHPDDADEFAFKVTKATVHGVTFVMGPAFPQVHITVENDEEMALLASAGIGATFAVNQSSWKSWPIADRDTPWDFEDAINRIAAWSGGDSAKFAQAFLYRDKAGDPNNRESYRAPLADVYNGKLTLIPRGVMAAATMLSGGHGGFEDIPQDQRTQMQEVITQIYDVLRDQYGDPRFIAPWQRGGRAGATSSEAAPTEAAMNPETMTLESIEEVAARTAAADAEPEGTPGSDETVVAASGTLYPPRAWFGDPKLRKKTPLQVTEDGRVFGHLATWKSCHLGVGARCVMAPKSATGYRHFHLGTVKVDDGGLIPTGKITLGTGHADKSFGVQPAAEHYDNTGTCVAVVRAGEDAYGIWVAGSLVTQVSEDKIAELRRSPLSGDWRRVNGNLELVAALAVNDPGFAVAHDDLDGLYSLVAAGVLVDDESDGPDPLVNLFAEVDQFLDFSDRTERRKLVETIYNDMLPGEGCGCGV